MMMPAIIINTCRGQDVGWGVFQSRQQQAHAENVAPGGPKLSPNPPPAPGPGGGRPETQLGQEPLSPLILRASLLGTLGLSENQLAPGTFRKPSDGSQDT